MSLVFANKSGTLQCMGGSVNLRSIIQQYLTPGNEGVWSLNDLQENIDLISSDASIIIDKTGGTGFDSSGNAIDSSGNKVLNLRVSAYGDIQNSIAGLEELFNPNEVGGVGTSSDTASASTSLWAYSKNAAATCSMVWNIDNPLFFATTTNNIAPTNAWTNAYQIIRTLTLTIPPGWIPRASTIPTLFIWNEFTTAPPATQMYYTQQYFTYQINAVVTEYALAGTSSVRPYSNHGQKQYTPITGIMTAVPLAPGDTLTIRYYGKMLQLASNVMTNPNERFFGVMTTGF
jgi:hypothetical protein